MRENITALLCKDTDTKGELVVLTTEENRFYAAVPDADCPSLGEVLGGREGYIAHQRSSKELEIFKGPVSVGDAVTLVCDVSYINEQTPFLVVSRATAAVEVWREYQRGTVANLCTSQTLETVGEYLAFLRSLDIPQSERVFDSIEEKIEKRKIESVQVPESDMSILEIMQSIYGQWGKGNAERYVRDRISAGLIPIKSEHPWLDIAWIKDQVDQFYSERRSLIHWKGPLVIGLHVIR